MHTLNGIGGINGTSFKLEPKQGEIDTKQSVMTSGHKRKSTVCVMDRTARKTRNQGHGSMPVQIAPGGYRAPPNAGVFAGNGIFAHKYDPADKETFRGAYNKSVPISEGSPENDA